MEAERVGRCGRGAWISDAWPGRMFAQADVAGGAGGIFGDNEHGRHFLLGCGCGFGCGLRGARGSGLGLVDFVVLFESAVFALEGAFGGDLIA